MATIALEGVSKEFRISRDRRVLALEAMDLRIAEGEFVALLGPSGCGKSTILHLVAGLDEPSTGRVLVDGVPPRELQAKQELGIAFQEHALLPWRTVEGNLELPFQIAGRRPDREHIAGLIDLVGLKGFESARPSQLSGGMRQRASIARALCLNPKLLLLDEPFGALDAVTRRSMNLELQRIWQQKRITTILVTHTVEEAIFLADRVLVMSGRPGRVVREVEVPFARPRVVETMRQEAFHRMVDDLTQSLEP
ncbi:ABC transporter ATP-binding protein [Granulicella sibirica]|uniref:Alkanesulfonates ABC transporter ATP-binding protein / Sulfonate ABC transporter, ATP-binding subunit SsuB n=1 Tax=Granulicella sibirica TaxID=2479048 RepID=A0A4Q0T4L5_9BACT|nr:ABC transporter ATP-binding protein [Granulicella sibirica]RXH58277.1 Alkanesulfonates ABC transporter ATP-binding protein / Sulfonate ABC transporter, ATP-binding subunit SsuB [Granulicella sibirica]